MLINGTEIINTCPHPIYLKDEGGYVHTIPFNQADLLRIHCQFDNKMLGPFRDSHVIYRYIDKLPPQKDNTIYIISAPTMSFLHLAGVKREDFRVLGSKDKDDPKIRIGFARA